MKIEKMIENAKKIASNENRKPLEMAIADYEEYPSNAAMANLLRVLANVIEFDS